MVDTQKQSSSEYINHNPAYHRDKNSRYILPNDAPEHVRLETQAYHLAAIMNGNIIHSPVDKADIRRILDVGCGTGVVTDYLGRTFPSADVVGLDLSSVPQIQGRDRPANVRFLQGNVMTGPPSSWKGHGDAGLPNEQAFDLIYSRLLVCGMTEWSRFLKTELALLKPGGWAEVHDLDWVWYDKAGNNISDSWPWWQTLRAAGEKQGLDFLCGSSAKGRMEEAGFPDVQVKEYYWPYGGQWETDEAYREFGEYVATGMVDLVWHVIDRLMTASSREEKDQMRMDMMRDFEPQEGKHWKFYVTCGRKPV